MLLFTLLFVLLGSNVKAQDSLVVPKLAYIKSVAVSSPSTISKDRSGNIYLLDSNSNLLRLSPEGNPLGIYSPPTRGRISGIEAWNPMKVLLFYQDRQQLLLLDRFLRPIVNTNLVDINYSGTAKVATLASDDGFWLFDETNLTLSKVDLRLRKVTTETPLNLILDKERFNVRQIREYQNTVYLLDANGIFVFDNLGTYKKKIPLKGLSFISFIDNELYFIKDGLLQFINLYTSESKAYKLPKNYSTALVYNNHVYLFNQKIADIYRWDNK